MMEFNAIQEPLAILTVFYNEIQFDHGSNTAFFRESILQWDPYRCLPISVFITHMNEYNRQSSSNFVVVECYNISRGHDTYIFC